MADSNGWAHDSEAGVDWRVGGQSRDRAAAGADGGGVYDWAGEDGGFPRQSGVSEPSFEGPTRGQRERAENGYSGPSRPTRHTHKEKTHNINVGFNGGGGGRGGNGNGGGGGAAGPGDRHQGDRLIHLVERIEIRSDKDILALARAINHLGRELHLILGMRAEEINGVLSTYKGKWYTFGASSRVKARLVSAHLKVSGEAAKALGVGALKMAHAFDRHFVKPEQEAKRRRNGQKPARKSFSIGEE
ncbi:hypothetical protein [Streptomyces nitrosporeus]|uniref:hypothetical protein n=1 Tax=Streptomyces nitrosporeus TaxID=28894 RepID=UPI00167C94B5|nr:hypothetical protein [Streptomyces nitrosporeus]GGZ29799.1 hypothetical protein GCM10010327_70080 [Streptomyces nitrosporeus]